MFWKKTPALVYLGGGLSLRADLLPKIYVSHVEPQGDLYRVVVRLFHYGDKFYGTVPMTFEGVEDFQGKLAELVSGS